MQYTLENKVYQNRFLILILAITASINIVSNYFGQDVAVISDSYLFIFLPGILVILSLMMNHRFGVNGKHGIAWILFTGFSISWFVAETTWILHDLYFEIEPFPSSADIFYIIGYPFLFVFMLFYLKPVRKGISHQMLVIAVALSVIILTTSITAALWSIEFDHIEALDEKEYGVIGLVISLAYPVLDAIVLVPAILGLLLFFKGQVSFLWSLMCLAILSVSIADAAFVIGHLEEFYHTGHHIDILFLWPYVLMSFGMYHHYSLFKN